MNDKKKILIVDDDTDLLRLYTNIFGGSNFEVMSEQKIDKAQKLIKEYRYDIILLDLMFPQGDNLETIKLARSDENPNHNTPIIVLTNLDNGEKTDKAIGAGANKCLMKANFTPRQLFNEVTKILNSV